MAVELAGGLGDVAFFALPGLGLAELTPALRRLPLPRRLAYGYLLGVGAVAGGLYALSHFLGVPLRPPAVWSAALAPALAGLAHRLTHRLRASSPRRGHAASPARKPPMERLGFAVTIACAAVVALVCLGVLADAVANPVKDWDGRMTWCAQARYIRAAGSVDAEVLRDGRWFITHPQYPLLLPVAQVAAQEAFAADRDSHAFRALYAAFFAALLLIVYDGARRWAGRLPAALVVLIAALVPFFTNGEGGATTTYSDLPLACFYGAALILLLARRARVADALAAGLLLAAAVLTKNEGVPLAAAALVLGAAAPGLGRRLPGGPLRRWRIGAGPQLGPGERRLPGGLLSRWRIRARRPPSQGKRRLPGGFLRGWIDSPRRRRRLRRLAAATVPALLALGLLVAWRSAIPNREDEGYLGFVRLPDLWPALFTRVATFGPALGARLGSWQHWRGFWWMAAVLLAAGWRLLRRPVSWRLLAAALAPPAIGWAAYSVHWDPVYLVNATWERLLLQGTVPMLLLLGCALAEVLGRDTAKRRAALRGANASLGAQPNAGSSVQPNAGSSAQLNAGSSAQPNARPGAQASSEARTEPNAPFNAGSDSA